MGMLHASTLNSLKNSEVVAITETEKFVANFLKKYTPKIRIYKNYETMIKSEKLDAVYITTPVNTHIEIASYCAKNEIPFFVEKPLGKTAKECKELCALLETKDVINMVGFNLRFSNTFYEAKKRLSDGKIGKIKKIKATAYRSLISKTGTAWRFKKDTSGGGVLIDIGIHAIDLLTWFFGDIESVKVTKSHYVNEIEDMISTKLFFKNKLQCDFETSWIIKNHRVQETTITIEGTLGKMVVSEDYIKNEIYENNEKEILYKQSLHRGVEFDVAGSIYTKEDIEFINAIKNKMQTELNVLESVKVQSIIDQIYKSSKTQEKENVNYFE